MSESSSLIDSLYDERKIQRIDLFTIEIEVRGISFISSGKSQIIYLLFMDICRSHYLESSQPLFGFFDRLSRDGLNTFPIVSIDSISGNSS